MINLSQEEQKIIKSYKALPSSVIEKRISEMKDDLIDGKDEDYVVDKKVIKELRRWLVTVGIFDKKQKPKKDINPEFI